MRVSYTVPSKRLTFTFDEPNRRGIVQRIAEIQELFDESVCGLCGADICFERREAKGYVFFNMRCLNPKCRAQLDIGENKEHTKIWVKRWDKEKKCEMPARGWHIYKRSDNGATAPGPDSQDVPPDTYTDEPPPF